MEQKIYLNHFLIKDAKLFWVHPLPSPYCSQPRLRVQEPGVWAPSLSLGLWGGVEVPWPKLILKTRRVA